MVAVRANSGYIRHNNDYHKIIVNIVVTYHASMGMVEAVSATGVTYHAAVAMVVPFCAIDDICSTLQYFWLSKIWSNAVLILLI